MQQHEYLQAGRGQRVYAAVTSCGASELGDSHGRRDHSSRVSGVITLARKPSAAAGFDAHEPVRIGERRDEAGRHFMRGAMSGCGRRALVGRRLEIAHEAR